VNLGLEGRTAIVCGASAGMGLAIAEALAEEGANVAMFARRRELLEREAERIGALAVRGDVTNPADLKRLVSRTVEAFGGVDILVNNSGGPPRGPAVGLTDHDYEAAFELLMLSAVRLTDLCLRHLERSGHGRIVNIESSSVREPVDNLALSNAIRPGVVGWAKTLAHELGPDGITINTIAPGKIDTDRVRELWQHFPDPAAAERADMEAVPARRLGKPDEIGAAVAFLCSTRAAYISGVVLPVDGGLLRGVW
jgi:3-oxoacyl-[acyl-carrier protein] reductase